MAVQQDHASDDRRVEATEAGEQPRFESNLRSPRPRPRRSRLMVKDVGQKRQRPATPSVICRTGGQASNRRFVQPRRERLWRGRRWATEPESGGAIGARCHQRRGRLAMADQRNRGVGGLGEVRVVCPTSPSKRRSARWSNRVGRAAAVRKQPRQLTHSTAPLAPDGQRRWAGCSDDYT